MGRNELERRLREIREPAPSPELEGLAVRLDVAPRP